MPQGADPVVAQAERLLVATADASDQGVDARVREVLGSLRQQMKMDVVFVSRFEDGRRTFQAVDAAPGRNAPRAGDSDPLEESWCHRVVTGRLPEFIRDAAPLRASGQAPATPLDIGTHLSVPLVLADGSVFGTLCTFAFHVDDDVSLHDLWRLRAVAQILAKRLDPGA